MQARPTEFTCAQCHEPIKLNATLLSHPSFESAVEPLFASASTSTPNLLVAREIYSPNKERGIPQPRFNSAAQHLPEPHDTFVLVSRPSSLALSNAAVVAANSTMERNSLSHRLKVANKLFELASGMSFVEHPLCQDCSDDLMIRLEKRLGSLKKERDAYLAYLNELESSSSIETDENVPSEDDLRKLQDREQKTLQTLQELDLEKETLQRELEDLEKEVREIDDLEKSHWQEICDFEGQARELQDEIRSLNMKAEDTTRLLEKLRKTNIYNDAFRIGHDGSFGTINGLRFGRLPNQPVEWTEINAAAGQALFLLDVLAKKLNFAFKGYKLCPMGSFSKIEKTAEGEKITLELYGSSDLTSMLFWNRRFDYALVAFLGCISQLGDYAEARDPKFRLPYRILKDKIGEVSVKLQFSQEEAWTKALKYILINLKWLIGFVSHRGT